MRKALIIGIDGQDGKLLELLLTSKKYQVFGVGRQKNSSKNYLRFDLSQNNYSELKNFIILQNPNEIYYVAAFHQSSQEKNKVADFEFIEKSVNVNQLGFMRVLELCEANIPAVKIIYTSSSLIFSGTKDPIQNEETPKEPRCIYSVTKCAAMDAAKFYREDKGLFVSVAIMYNHESKFRNNNFLSKKIINDTKLLIEKKIDSIVVGDLGAKTDWGYAPDYVEAMWHILQQSKPNNYIVSSGKAHQVKDWFEVLFNSLNLNWKDYVKEDPKLVFRKKPLLIGDNSKLLSTGWMPKINFEQMVMKIFNDQI